MLDPIRFGYHCALLDALTDYIRKYPEDILQWYLDGEPERKLGIGVDLIVRWGITTYSIPQTHIPPRPD